MRSNKNKEKTLLCLKQPTGNLRFYGKELAIKYPERFNFSTIIDCTKAPEVDSIFTKDLLTAMFDNTKITTSYYHLLCFLKNTKWIIDKYYKKLDYGKLLLYGIPISKRQTNFYIKKVLENPSLIDSYCVLSREPNLTIDLVNKLRSKKKDETKFFYELSFNGNLPYEVIKEFKDKIDWSTMVRRREKKFTKKVKEEFKDYIPWPCYVKMSRNDLEEYCLPYIIKSNMRVKISQIPEAKLNPNILVQWEDKLLEDKNHGFLISLLTKNNSYKLTSKIKEFILNYVDEYFKSIIFKKQEFRFTDKDILENIDKVPALSEKRIEKIKNKDLKLLVTLKRSEWRLEDD